MKLRQANKSTLTEYWMGGIKYSDSTFNLIKMARFRRGIQSFIKVVTGKSVPVKWVVQGGHTDSQSVYISASIPDNKIDATVGLALHEASHIVKSDFDLMKKIVGKTSPGFNKVLNKTQKKFPEMSEKFMANILKELTNWVEDRRIDDFQYRESPGYRGYYDTFYSYFFNSEIINKGLESNDYREENWKSYRYRLINLMNPKSDLSALKGLKEIYDLIDLPNIKRLKSSSDAYKLAKEIWDIILENLESIEVPPDEDIDNENCDDKECKDGGGKKGNGSGGNGKISKFLKKKQGSSSGAGKLSKDELEKLEKAIEKQIKTINGDFGEKEELSEKQAGNLKQIEKSQASIKDVGEDFGTVKTIVIHKLDKKILSTLPLGTSYPSSEDAVLEGIKMGKALTRKLQIRTEDRETEYVRKRKGKINKRLLHTIPTGINRIFKQTYVDSYGSALIHISIDASSSMSGNKWNRTMALATALSYTAEKTEKLDIIVSFRTTSDERSLSGLFHNISKPMVIIAFDSRNESFSKVRNLFPYMTPSNYTPEGLSFESIAKEIMIAMRGKQDKYFINFSDGQPYVPGMYNKSGQVVTYQGSPAAQQTRREVQKMIKNGIKILSFFITESSSMFGGSSDSEFKTMYGKSASFIDVDNITSVAREMNRRLLAK